MKISEAEEGDNVLVCNDKYFKQSWNLFLKHHINERLGSESGD